jgi:protoporphyrinogen oxidase
VVIFGGGISGLSIAVRLVQAGLPVTLLEAAARGESGWCEHGDSFLMES